MAAKKRSASLSVKLKQTQTEKRRLERSISMGQSSFTQKHSTMTEDHFSKDNDSSLMSSMNNLSFASLNVSECKPVDGEEEIDKKSFVQWKELLEASMQLVEVTDEDTQMRIFKIKAGTKLLDVLYGTTTSSKDPNPDSEPYSNAMSRLQNYFGSRDYLLMQRQKLRSMYQEPAEADMKYVKRIIAAAKLCDFEDEQLLENVCHIIQSHATNSKIREIGRKVLRKGGTLVILLDKIRVQEVERINEEIYLKNHQVRQVEVAAVSYGQTVKEYGKPSNRFMNATDQRTPGTWQSFRGRGGFSRQGTMRNTNRTRGACWRCTSRYHSATECFAMQKVCHNCNKKGHLERACQLPVLAKDNSRSKNQEIDDEVPSKVRKIAVVTKNEFCNDPENAVSE